MTKLETIGIIFALIHSLIHSLTHHSLTHNLACACVRLSQVPTESKAAKGSGKKGFGKLSAIAAMAEAAARLKEQEELRIKQEEEEEERRIRAEEEEEARRRKAQEEKEMAEREEKKKVRK
eukprot:GHVU01170338.1.p1 GENE.GHVU01170338.1~~GHVU01170338.1.p1  ORF type:complete len:121 (-),score=41.90 GHVU01170338.1:300-662(-)